MKAVLLFAILALAANVATATHFRYMTMSWSRSSSSSLEVKVKLQAAFRAGFWTNSPLTVGQTVSGVGNVDFGNGNAAVPIALRVTSYNGNTAEPWFIGESEVTVSYDDPDQFTVIWSDCCRIAGLEDGNSEQYYTVVMTLDLTSSLTQSAQVTQFPLMYFNLNKANNIQLPFLKDSNDASPAFTIRTAGTGLTTAQPAGLTVSSNGVVNWTPTKIGLYAIQFAATTPGSSLPLDLILSVVQATNDPPSIDAPTVTSITFVPGTVVTFPVVGSDPDSGDTVTITSTSLPNGASLSTCTPAQVCNEVFSWPTNAATTSAIVCFQAADDKGNNSAQKCVTLVPDSNNPCPSGTIGGAGCVSKTISNKCVGHGFNTVTESAGGCATIAFDAFGTGC